MNFLRLKLWYYIYPILECVFCAFDMNVCYVAVGLVSICLLGPLVYVCPENILGFHMVLGQLPFNSFVFFKGHEGQSHHLLPSIISRRFIPTSLHCRMHNSFNCLILFFFLMLEVSTQPPGFPENHQCHLQTRKYTDIKDQDCFFDMKVSYWALHFCLGRQAA